MLNLCVLNFVDCVASVGYVQNKHTFPYAVDTEATISHCSKISATESRSKHSRSDESKNHNVIDEKRKRTAESH